MNHNCDSLGSGLVPPLSVIANVASKVPWAIVAVSVAQIMVELILSREEKLELALLKT